MASNFTIRKNPAVSLKARYGVTLRWSLIAALSIVIAGFLIVPPQPQKPTLSEDVSVEIEMVEVPQTEQQAELVRPVRPAIPVPAEEEDLPGEIDYGQFEFQQFTPVRLPPPPIADSFDSTTVPITPPEPLGGYDRISDLVEYPSMARYAGLEGTVHIEVLIDKQGSVVGTNILEGAPKTGFEEAALAVIHNLQFKPAMRYDEPIPSRDSIRVDFRLR
jgi:protein TonB